MTEKLSKIKTLIEPVLEEYDVKKSSVFGSFARGEDAAKSDIDILVELGSQRGLFTLVRLKRDLEATLGKQVDLLTYNSINPLLRKHIEKDEVKVYG